MCERDTIKQEDGAPLMFVDDMEPRELLDLYAAIQGPDPPWRDSELVEVKCR